VVSSESCRGFHYCALRSWSGMSNSIILVIVFSGTREKRGMPWTSTDASGNCKYTNWLTHCNLRNYERPSHIPPNPSLCTLTCEILLIYLFLKQSFATQPRQAWNSWSFCFSFLSTEIIGMHHMSGRKKTWNFVRS
jgi:hypothetical protein